MTLSIQSIRSSLANLSTPPAFKLNGGGGVAAEANKVKDTASFSAQGTSLASETLAQMRTRFDAAQGILPSRRDEAVLVAGRASFNTFRNATQSYRAAGNLAQTNLATVRPAPVTTPPESAIGAVKTAGVATPVAAPRQQELLPPLGPFPRATVAENIGSALGTPLQNAKPVQTINPAEGPFPAVAPPLTPRQPDTAVTAGFRDRNKGGFAPNAPPSRPLGEVPTVADRRLSPAQATGITTPPARGIQAPQGERFALVNGQQNGLRRQPANYENGRLAVGVNQEINNPANRVPAPAANAAGKGNQNPRVAPRVEVTANGGGVPSQGIAATNRVPPAPVANAAGGANQNPRFAPRVEVGRGVVPPQGVATPTPGPQFGQAQLRGVAPPTQAAQFGRAQPQGGLPALEPANGPQEGALGGPVAFAFVRGFQGRAGEPNPSTLPQAAPLKFPSRSPAEISERNPAGTGGPEARPRERLAAAANVTPTPNPTVVPVSRDAALGFYARLGSGDVSQEATNTPARFVA